MTIRHPKDNDRKINIDIAGLTVRLFQDGTLIAVREFISVESMWRYLSDHGFC